MTAAGEEGHAQEGASAGDVYDPFGLDLDLDVVTSADLVALHRAVLAQPMGGTGIVVARATGSELVDPDGTGYLDCLSGLGDARFGHRHPRLLAAARRQLDRSGLLAPAVSDDQTGRFARDFAALVGQRRVAVVESGSAARALAESLARAWVGAGRGVSAASVVVGSVVGDRMPSQPPDVLVVEAVDPTTVRICDGAQVAALAQQVRDGGGLVVADERLTGLGRCGVTGLVDGLGIPADLVVHGEALGGGLVRLGAVAGRSDVLGQGTEICLGGPLADRLVDGFGDRLADRLVDGFGGRLADPLASAVAHETVAMLGTGEYQRRAASLGRLLNGLLQPLVGVGGGLSEARVVGLWAGLDIDPHWAPAADVAARLKCYGVLVRPPVGSCLVLAPPLVISEDGVRRIVHALREALGSGRESGVPHDTNAGLPPVERLTCD